MEYNEGTAFAELPGVTVPCPVGRDYDFTGFAVEIATVTAPVTIDGDAVAERSAGYPEKFGRNVSGRTSVPDTDTVVVKAVDPNVLREGFVFPCRTSVFFFVPDADNYNADSDGRNAEESQAHLPGGIEDGFEGCVHDRFPIFVLPI